jgi:hypothetical protein
MGVNVETHGVADKREELSLETNHLMRRIRAAISPIASHETTPWIHANETNISHARKTSAAFAADE